MHAGLLVEAELGAGRAGHETRRAVILADVVAQGVLVVGPQARHVVGGAAGGHLRLAEGGQRND